MTPIQESVYVGLCLLVDGGLNTYGAWSNELLLTKGKLYGFVIEEDARINQDVIQETVNNYLRGKITRYQDGAQVPVGSDFPTAAQFYDACLQTFHMMYRTVSVGESEIGGNLVLHTLTVRRNIDPVMLDMMITEERRRLGLPVAEPHKPLSHDQERKASEIIRRVFGDAPKLNKDGQE